jgi:hypothetical protein
VNFVGKLNKLALDPVGEVADAPYVALGNEW